MRVRDRPAAGVAAVITATIGFSTGFPIVKGLDLPAASVGFWRLLVGIVVLGSVAWYTGTARPARWWPVLGGGLAFAVHQLIFIQATKLTAIAVVTLFGAMQPLLVSLVSRRTVGERVPPALLGCALVALSGVMIVVVSTAGDESRNLLGDLLAAANLGAFTTYFLFAKRARLTGTSALSFTVWFMGIALVALLPAVALADRVVPPTTVDAAWVVALALLPGNGHLLVNWAHGRVTVALSSIILAGIPLLGAVWGRIFFDEPFGWAHVAGLLLVIAAIEGGRRVERNRVSALGAAGAEDPL